MGAPRELTAEELDQIAGGINDKFTTVQTNPGGQTLPSGSNSQGTAITTTVNNPGGNAPPGQQP